MKTVSIFENKGQRPEFLKIDHMEDGKGGSILLNVTHIVSVRYCQTIMLGEAHPMPCSEFRMIDGSDIRICGEKAERLWRALRQVFSVWEYQG